MSEDVIRTGRDLAYQGTVLKVYKDHMKFQMEIQKNGILFIMTALLQLSRLWRMEDLDGKTVPKCVGTRHIGNSGWKTG